MTNLFRTTNAKFCHKLVRFVRDSPITKIILVYFMRHTGFLHRPWIQGQPWKVLKFQKNWKSPWIVLENEWKVLKSLEFAYAKLSTRLGDCENFLPQLLLSV